MRERRRQTGRCQLVRHRWQLTTLLLLFSDRNERSRGMRRLGGKRQAADGTTDLDQTYTAQQWGARDVERGLGKEED